MGGVWNEYFQNLSACKLQLLHKSGMGGLVYSETKFLISGSWDE